MPAPQRTKYNGGRMASLDSVETEIKLRVCDAAAARAQIESAGFRVRAPRAFERNVVFDTPEFALKGRRELIRIRQVDGKITLTFKGPRQPGKHKVREELESSLSDASAVERIFERVGLRPVFRYEKYRTEYCRNSDPGVVMLDETPIGNYLELEGPSEWIDATARELGFSESEYLLASYASLYLEYCRQRNIEPADMAFPNLERTP
jgi:adenylate cyclase class 2